MDEELLEILACPECQGALRRDPGAAGGGTARRLSRGAPAPVVAVTRDTRAPGGAANVAVNIACLGAGAQVAGFVGVDPAGREIARVLRRHGIGAAGAAA